MIVSDVNKARTLKAKAKATVPRPIGNGHPNAKAYDEIWSNEILFFRVLLQGYKHSLITSLISHWHDYT